MPNKLSQFWQELKDRRVIRTTTVYVAVAFGMMELIDIISGPLNLPGWVLTVFIFISALGFPVIILISWIFYFSPDGIKQYQKHPTTYLPEPTADNEGVLLFEVNSKNLTESTRPDKRSGKIIGLSSFTVICLVIVLFLFYGGQSAPFNERDWVVLADFVNHTEELIFDNSLNTAFEISIDQSRHINVVPRKRMQEALKRIGKEPGTIIDEAICREIAIREGAKVFIIPEISRVGHQYLLSGKLQETENGSVVTSEVFYCKSQDEIIGMLDRMSKKMRRHLGESRYKISGQSKPLSKVTTSSLDALKQFSLGIEYHLNLDFEKAAFHYRNAIRIDSTFTAAKASLGNILYIKFDQVEGIRWLDEAIQSIDNLTDHEKYSILGFYAANVEKDMEKCIEYTMINIELYPDNASARHNLGWYFQMQGRWEESVAEYKAAIALEPYLMLPYGGLLWVLGSYLGQNDSVFYYSKQMINFGPENPWGYFYLGVAYFNMDELERAREEFEKVGELSPGLSLNQYNLAHTYRILGKYELAVEIFKRILELYPEESDPHYYLGICYNLMGADEMSVSSYQRFLSMTEFQESQNPGNPEILMAKGTVLTRLGRNEEGMETGRRGYEMDTAYHYSYAQLLAVQNKTEEALHHLEIAIEKGFRDLCWIKMDPDLTALRNDERVLRLMEQYFN
ncbi:MAG: tetratricopeptide repeat protein [Bacteroidota bacterium]|nr:tetratricopeptide repeat protein [Bacteroidota bacterium]